MISMARKKELIFSLLPKRDKKQQRHGAINGSKNAFEPPIYEKIDPERAMQAVKEDIQVITRFVDELQLSSGMFR